MAALWLGAPGALAADTTIAVTTTDDELNADGDCSLREAVIAANTDAAVDACAAGSGYDTILLSGGTYELTLAGPDEDLAATGDLDVTEPLNLTRTHGSGEVVIDGGGIDRVFDVIAFEDHRTGFSGITIQGGAPPTGGGGGIRLADACGANPSARWTFGLNNVTLRNNTAEHGGGVAFGECHRVSVQWSTVMDNVASSHGGGIAIAERVVAQVYASTVSGNRAGSDGGGVWWSAEFLDYLTFSSATIAYNSATSVGGIWLPQDPDVSVLMDNTLLAGNAGGNCRAGTFPNGDMIGSDDSTCASSRYLPNPGLEPISLVNGRGWVHLLSPDSDAIDVGAGVHTCPPYDQIGTARPQDGDGDGVATCDIGAIEAPAAEIPDTALSDDGLGAPLRRWWLPAILLAAAALAGVAARRARQRRAPTTGRTV